MDAHRLSAAALLIALTASGNGAAQESEPAEEPRELGITERAESRLAQIDITVSGPPEVITKLTADDFRIKVNMTKIREFQLDSLCTPPGLTATDPAAAGAGASAARPVTPAATYLFYFDQPHLTLAGRASSMDLARQLIRSLIADGNRGIVMSNARRLAVIEPLTDDPQLLLDGIDRLEGDFSQWDMFSEEEDSRIERVVEALNEYDNLTRAVAAARVYQKEELLQTDKDFRRLKLALGQLVETDPPKALVYFADHIRSNPGAHYASFFGDALRRRESTLQFMEGDIQMGGLAFDEVVNAAAAQGIRLYPVQAQGLVAPVDRNRPSSVGVQTGGTAASSSRIRTGDTLKTMRDMAGETGGQPFLHGIAAPRIVERIRADASCLYLASFDPSEFREDAPLRIVVKTPRDDIRIRSRGRLVVQSEAARRTSRLLLAFGSPGEISDPVEVRAVLVPTGFDEGTYSALLQLRVPGTPLQTTTWDLGASIVHRDRVSEETSGRMSVGAPGVQVIFETELRLKPGSYEIVAVVHETSSGLMASEQIDIDWPDPNREPGTVGPISLIQPADGAFLRAGSHRREGSVAIPPGDPVAANRPLALVGLVCRGRKERGGLSVERRLIGGSTVDYPPMEFDLERERCAQIRDLFPADTLGPGSYRYEMRVLQDERSLHQGSREFIVVAPPS